MEKSRGADDQVNQMSQALNRLCAGPRATGRLSAATSALEIRSRNARVAALQKRWGRLRAELDLILDHGADMARSAYGASGLLVRGYKGKEADRLVNLDRPRRGLAGRRAARPRAPGGRGIGPVEDCASRSASPSTSHRRRSRSP